MGIDCAGGVEFHARSPCTCWTSMQLYFEKEAAEILEAASTLFMPPLMTVFVQFKARGARFSKAK